MRSGTASSRRGSTSAASIEPPPKAAKRERRRLLVEAENGLDVDDGVDDHQRAGGRDGQIDRKQAPQARGCEIDADAAGGAS